MLNQSSIEAPSNPGTTITGRVGKILKQLRGRLGINNNEITEERDLTIKPQMIAFGGEGVITPFPKRSAGITSKGTRGYNQDGILIGKNFVALADGVGGGPDGEKCSGFVLEAVSKELEGNKISSADAIDKSAAYLRGKAQQGDLDSIAATTLVIAQITIAGEKIVIETVNSGDSQILIIDRKKKKVIYESKEQTAKGLDGEIPPSNSPEKYVGDRDDDRDYLIGGIDGCERSDHQLEPEIFEIEGEKENIAVVLNCDGISKLVSPEEICDIVCDRRKTPEQMVRTIEQIAIRRHMSHEIRVKINGTMHQIKRELMVRDNTSCVVMLA